MNSPIVDHLDKCSLFSPYIEPATGITSYVLSRRVAPVQQSFYFTNTSFSADGRYLWFYCAHPPSGRMLGVADLVKETVVWFPDTVFRDASPYIDAVTGDAYWCWDYSVYCRSPDPDAAVKHINSVPESIHRNRLGKRLSTHLTISANRREFLIDAHLGREWCIGSLPLNGGAFQVWQTLDRCYNHAQFSPMDPDLALVAQDWWLDVVTGENHPYENRIWLLRRGEKIRPVLSGASSISHEWWDPDGKHIWYVDYHNGTEKVDTLSGRITRVWPNGTCHSHSSANGQYLVGDIGPYSWMKTGCRVAFFNVATRKEVDIVSNLPLPLYPRSAYHIDPHPQFCLNDDLVAYTTTVMGKVDVALVRTKDLILASSSGGG